MAARKKQTQGIWKTINGAHILLDSKALKSDGGKHLPTATFDKLNKLPSSKGKSTKKK